LIDENGNSKGELHFRQYKSIRTDRVILLPGPECEIAIVGTSMAPLLMRIRMELRSQQAEPARRFDGSRPPVDIQARSMRLTNEEMLAVGPAGSAGVWQASSGRVVPPSDSSGVPLIRFPAKLFPVSPAGFSLRGHYSGRALAAARSRRRSLSCSR
jgi:hypothetical protein